MMCVAIMCECIEFLEKSGYVDIRTRCMPTDMTFENCCMKIDNIYELIVNDYYTYKFVETNKGNINCIKMSIIQKYKLTPSEWKEFRELYNKYNSV